MHRNNNQDHSMLTAMLAVDNILGGTHDLWSVDLEQEPSPASEIARPPLGDTPSYAEVA
jgi:hypothetical protein